LYVVHCWPCTQVRGIKDLHPTSWMVTHYHVPTANPQQPIGAGIVIHKLHRCLCRSHQRTPTVLARSGPQIPKQRLSGL
jgi:hypothetical protein